MEGTGVYLSLSKGFLLDVHRSQYYNISYGRVGGGEEAFFPGQPARI